MKERRVYLAPEAREQARIIDAWWRENRPSAPELFVAELSRIGTAGSTSSARCMAVSAMRRPQQEGQKPRPLQEKPTSLSRPHVAQYVRQDAADIAVELAPYEGG